MTLQSGLRNLFFLLFSSNSPFFLFSFSLSLPCVHRSSLSPCSIYYNAKSGAPSFTYSLSPTHKHCECQRCVVKAVDEPHSTLFLVTSTHALTRTHMHTHSLSLSLTRTTAFPHPPEQFSRTPTGALSLAFG